MRRLRWSFSLASLLIFSAGCQNMTIESPARDGVYEEAPDFRISFRGGAPAGLTMHINGEEITDLFQVGASEAVAPGATVSPFLQEGRNVFEAKSSMGGVGSPFALDRRGPSIHINSVGTGNPAEVQGWLEDPAGPARLEFEGQNVTLTDDRFTVFVPDMPFMHFEAEDTFGHVSETTFARPGVTIPSTAVARLNQSGIGFLIQEVEGILNDLDFGELLDSLNPIFDEGDWWASARVDATGMELDPIDLDLAVSTTAARTFDVSVRLPNVVVKVSARGTIIGVNWSANGKVGADLGRFNGQAKVSITGSEIQVNLSNLSASLQGFYFDISGFPDVLESIFFDVVRDLLEGFIEDELASRLPPLIEGFLSQIPSEFVFELGGADFQFAALPAWLETYEAGLSAGLGGGMKTLSPAQVPRPLGSRYVGGDAPRLSTQTPGGISFDAGAGVSVDLMNQALLAAYRAGLLHLELDENFNPLLNIFAFGDLYPELIVDYEAASLRFRILPDSPPFGSLSRGASNARLTMHEFKFELDMMINEEWVYVLGAVVDLSAPFDVNVTEDNFLDISFDQVPQVTVYSIDDGGVIHVDPGVVQDFLDRLLPLALPYLVDIIEQIPIPQYEGYGIHVREIWTANDSESYLALAGNLIKVEQTAAAPAPETFVALSANDYSSDGFYTELYPGVSFRHSAEFNVDLAGFSSDGQPLEYSYRLDGAPWSVWKDRDRIVLRNLLGGTHTLEIRARTWLLKADQSPARIVFGSGRGLSPHGESIRAE